MQRPLRRSRSFKVIDFGTNGKLIYDFLLVINTNLRHILHPVAQPGFDLGEGTAVMDPEIWNTGGSRSPPLSPLPLE